MKLFSLIFMSIMILQCSHSGESTSVISEESSEVKDPLTDEREIKKYRFAIISDMNGSYGSTTYGSDVSRAINYIKDSKNKVNFVLSTGDMVAGQKSNLDYTAMWKSFHSVVTKPLVKEKIAIYPSPGNHDAHLDREIERNHYKTSWLNENVLSAEDKLNFVTGVEQNFPFQYAFKIGSALFIALDNTAATQWTEKTYLWMEKILIKESKANLKFIYGHVPLLPFAFQKETEYVARGNVSFLNDIENLFSKHKVDVFFSGHSHVYYPGRRNSGTEYISVPLLGSGTRYILSNDNFPRSKTGFLVIDFDSAGDWSLKNLDASTYSEVLDKNYPESVVMPSKNSSLCVSCTAFPKTHFLDPLKRIIYHRRDL